MARETFVELQTNISWCKTAAKQLLFGRNAQKGAV